MNSYQTYPDSKLNRNHFTKYFTNIKPSFLILKLGIILTFLCLSIISANAQIGFGEEPTIWIRSNDQEMNYKVNESNYLGNYPVLDLTTEGIRSTFEKLGKENRGTLFLAGRFPNEDHIIEFGKISFSYQLAEAGQHTIEYDSLSGEGSILKVSYNISPKYRKGDFDFLIHDEVEIAEILFFKDGLTEKECRKVESYLAIKYSINITKNTDNKLRNYLNTDENNVWDFPSDALYDEEVIGLGRCDKLMFNQTQTYSADTKQIKLAFPKNDQLGDMPHHTLMDNSYLILSKKTDELTNVICGGTASIKPWKLSLHNWTQSNPDKAFLWMDTIPDEEMMPILTDGYKIIELESEIVNGGNQMTLPIGSLDFDQDYFIVWNLPEDGCDPLAKMQLELCDESLGIPNTLTIEVEDEGISSQILLHNQTSGEQFTYDLYQNIGEISNLPEGLYELVVTHESIVLIDQLFHCEHCDGVTSGGSPIFIQSNKDNGGTNRVNASYGIRAYPNPVAENSNVLFKFWGFDDQEFDIQISDQTGKVMDVQSFQYSDGNTIWTYQFGDIGVFNIRIFSANYTEVKRIIVQ